MSRTAVLLLAAWTAGLAVWLRGAGVSRVRGAGRGPTGRAAWSSAVGDGPGRIVPASAGGPDRPPGARLGQAWSRVRPGPGAPVAELLAGLAGELSAGQPLADALEAAAAGLTPDPCPHARRAARVGDSIPAGLRRDARARGAHGLRALAACWEVAQGSGAGLAQAVGRLADGQRASAEAQAQLDAEVAAVRTSARLLAALPLVGLLGGHWMGADPVGWLTGSWGGRGVLLVGLALQAAGLLWLHRIVAAVRTSL